jgi:ribosomal protein L22
MSPDEPDKTPDEAAPGTAGSEEPVAAPEAETPAADEVPEPAAEAETPAADEVPEPAAEAETPAADEVPDPAAEAADEKAEAGATNEPSTEAPKRPRRRRRGAAEEPAAAKPTPGPKPEKPASPSPTRRRSRREPGAPAPVVRAQAKYVRSSARKARLVCDHIRGKSVEEARAILALTPRAIARDWSKLLESAVANAEHNHELVGEDLVVKAVHADEGPTIKRFRPRAMGRATRIRKRTSHLTILLTPKD